MQWRFTAEEAARIRQPVLAVISTETAPIFRESHALVKQWMPQAEELVVPQATHALQYMNPSAVAGDGRKGRVDGLHTQAVDGPEREGGRS